MATERISSLVRARGGTGSSSIVSPVFADVSIRQQQQQRINAVLFLGDHVKQIDRVLSPTVDCLSNIKNIGPILSQKLGPGVDVWIVEAPRFAWKSMACYDGFLHWVNQWGNPYWYDPRELPAATTTLSVLRDAARQLGTSKSEPPDSSAAYRTIFMGFSKGGVVLNQLMAELAYIHSPDYKNSSCSSTPNATEFASLPRSGEEFLNSIEQFHYIDVGMNECGAYMTDKNVLEQIAKVASTKDTGLTVYMHGTPRQWRDPLRGWLCAEKDQCVKELREVGRLFADGKLKVEEKMYFSEETSSLDMHFAILEVFEISVD